MVWSTQQLAHAIIHSMREEGQKYAVRDLLLKEMQKSKNANEIIHAISKNFQHHFEHNPEYPLCGKSVDALREAILTIRSLTPGAAAHFIYALIRLYPKDELYLEENVEYIQQKYTQLNPDYKGKIPDEAIDEHGNTMLMCVAQEYEIPEEYEIPKDAKEQRRIERALAVQRALQKAVIKHSSNFAFRNHDQQNALHIAVLHGNKEYVRLLLTGIGWSEREMEDAYLLSKHSLFHKNMVPLFFVEAVYEGYQDLVLQIIRNDAEIIGKVDRAECQRANISPTIMHAMEEIGMLDPKMKEEKITFQQIAHQFNVGVDKKKCLEQFTQLADSGADIKQSLEEILQKVETEIKKSQQGALGSESFIEARSILIFASDYLFKKGQISADKMITIDNEWRLKSVDAVRNAFADLFPPPLPAPPPIAAPTQGNPPPSYVIIITPPSPRQEAAATR